MPQVNTTFYAIHNNGVAPSSLNLIDLAQLPDVSYLIKTEQEVNGLPKYTAVNPDGSVRFLKHGIFELRDVSYIHYNSLVRRYSVTLTICDTRLNEVFEETIECTSGVQMFHANVIPFLNLLNEHGSYISYKQSLELTKLMSRIEELTKQLEECKKERESE